MGEKKEIRKEKEVEAEGEGFGEGDEEGSQIIPTVGGDLDQWALSYIAGDSIN